MAVGRDHRARRNRKRGDTPLTAAFGNRISRLRAESEGRRNRHDSRRFVTLAENLSRCDDVASLGWMSGVSVCPRPTKRQEEHLAGCVPADSTTHLLPAATVIQLTTGTGTSRPCNSPFSSNLKTLILQRNLKHRQDRGRATLLQDELLGDLHLAEVPHGLRLADLDIDARVQ